MWGLRCFHAYKRSSLVSVLITAAVSAVFITFIRRHFEAGLNRKKRRLWKANSRVDDDLLSDIMELQGAVRGQLWSDELTHLDPKSLLREVETELKHEGWVVPTNIMVHIAKIRISKPLSLQRIDNTRKEGPTELLAVAERWKVLHVGCFNESDTMPTLGEEKGPVRVGSARECIHLCSDSKSTYISISRGTFCRCGVNISMKALEADFDSQKCNYKCHNESLQPCNADKFKRVYRIAEHSLDDMTLDSIRRSSLGCFRKPKVWNDIFKPQVMRQERNAAQCLLTCERANFVIAAWDNSKDCRCGKFTPEYTPAKWGQKVNDSYCELITGDYVMIMRTLSVDGRCESSKLLPRTFGRLVALASYPGSGNTWTRHLIEAATGIYTGSDYMDEGLFRKGFLGEPLPWNSTRTSVIKTHKVAGNEPYKFDEVVLIIRNPYDAIMAEFNRLRAGHTGYAEPELFFKPVWRYFIAHDATRWYTTIEKYTMKQKKLIIFYEDMVENSIEELKKIVNFLNYPILDIERRLACIESNMIGKFKRPKKELPFDPYTQRSKHIVNICIRSARKLMTLRGLPTLPNYER